MSSGKAAHSISAIYSSVVTFSNKLQSMPRAQKRVQVLEDVEADDAPTPPKASKASKPKPKKTVCLKTLQKNLKEALEELEQLRNPLDIPAEHAEMLRKLEMFKGIFQDLEDEFQSFLFNIERIWDPFTLDDLDFCKVKSKVALLNRQ